MIRPLSNDGPRSLVLALVLGGVVLLLVAAPFLFPGARALDTAAKILVFAVLVASYDLVLGYAGIVSFAHTMFFGIGAYGVAIASVRMGPGFGAIAVGTVAALALSAALSAAIGLFSLRVRAVFFAMITLAVATAFSTLVSQLSDLTGGEDGLSFRMPDVLNPGFRLLPDRVFGTVVNGRVLTYYLVLAAAAALFLLMLRVVNSPFGRVLQAIRENDFRAEAIGYRTVVYRTVATVLAALFATLAGALLAVWLRYNGPETTLSLEIMVDILLIVVIGGMGTMWGAVIGSALFLVAQTYLQDLMALAAAAAAPVPPLATLLAPDRWLLWLGVLFIASVYLVPQGIVGTLRYRAARPRRPRMD